MSDPIKHLQLQTQCLYSYREDADYARLTLAVDTLLRHLMAREYTVLPAHASDMVKYAQQFYMCNLLGDYTTVGTYMRTLWGERAWRKTQTQVDARMYTTPSTTLLSQTRTLAELLARRGALQEIGTCREITRRIRTLVCIIHSRLGLVKLPSTVRSVGLTLSPFENRITQHTSKLVGELLVTMSNLAANDTEVWVATLGDLYRSVGSTPPTPLGLDTTICRPMTHEEYVKQIHTKLVSVLVNRSVDQLWLSSTATLVNHLLVLMAHQTDSTAYVDKIRSSINAPTPPVTVKDAKGNHCYTETELKRYQSSLRFADYRLPITRTHMEISNDQSK